MNSSLIEDLFLTFGEQFNILIMRKNLCLAILSIVCFSTTFAQNIVFEQIHPLPPTPPMFADFVPVTNGSVAYSDVDNDNDQDLLITGANGLGPFSILYINDGLGNFSEAPNTPFDAVASGCVAFADIDGDNDADVMVTGSISTIFDEPTTKLYINDGAGNFTEVTNTPFEDVHNSAIDFSDVDGDNHPDVIITGLNLANQRIAKLYKNDGFGNFTEILGTPFEGVQYGSIDFSDIDDDNDLDVVIIGLNSSDQTITKLYENIGLGNFSLILGTTFSDIAFGDVAFADVDNDTDFDLLLTGSNDLNQPITKLYLNDSTGLFTEALGTPFTNLTSGSIAFSDIDNDSDLDVFICGNNNSNQPISTLFTNDSLGTFTEVTGISFDPLTYSSILFTDIDNDNAPDALLTGYNGLVAISKLYHNDSLGNFTEATGTPFEMIMKNSIAFSDADGDSDPDVVLTGTNIPYNITKLYSNDGMGNFSEVPGTPFSGVSDGAMAIADVDNDGDSDVLITGHSTPGVSITKLYMNDGNGTYVENTNTSFIGIKESAVAFSDVDDDQDLDLLITGRSNSSAIIARMYLNDGSGTYTEVSGTTFQGVTEGAIAFSDVDGDNDNDVLITGENTAGQFTPRLYKNDGSGNFTFVPLTPFDPIRFSSIAFEDVDGDNDSDLVISGEGLSNIHITKLYVNDGIGNFTEAFGSTFEGLSEGAIGFFDVDNDDDQDLMITGWNDMLEVKTNLYVNDGTGNFTEILDTPFDGVMLSAIDFSDVDGDYDLDVLITGRNRHLKPISKLYRNDSYCVPDSVLNSISQIGSELTVNTNGFSYQWINCDSSYAAIIGETNQTFTPSTNGLYAVIISTGTCSDTSNCITINDAGIKVHSFDHQIIAHPNPTSGQVSILFNQVTSNIEVSVLTTEGRVISTNSYKNQKMISFFIDGVPGTYLIKISSSHFNQTLKMIKW